MSDLTITEPLATRLRELAAREQRSVEAILEAMIERYPSAVAPKDDPLLKIAGVAEAANLEFSETDVTARSREILNTEYADYLLKRTRRS
jgi:hypothetical protein